GAVGSDRHPVRAAGILARPHADDGVHVLGALASRVRCHGTRRRHARGLEWIGRPAAPSRASAHHAHAHRRGGGRTLRPRRDARGTRTALRHDRRGEGAFARSGRRAARRAQRDDPGDHPPRDVPPRLALGHRARGSGVRVARRGAPVGRSRAGSRLPRDHGGDGRDGRAGRRGQSARRRLRGLDRPPHPVRETRHVSRLRRDRRAVFGIAVLAIVTGAGVAAPVISTGAPTAQHEVVATRFQPPLSTDRAGTFHLLGTDRFGRDVWTRLVYGARISIAVGGVAVLLSVAIGLVVGAAAGYWPGVPRVVLLGVTDFTIA